MKSYHLYSIHNGKVCVCVYRWSVAKGCIERLCVRVEEVLDISETFHLELLWLLLNHLPVKPKTAQVGTVSLSLLLATRVTNS